MKSPFNWAGNKLKYIPKFEALLKCDTIVELFGGTCNISFSSSAEKIIINDNISTLMQVYRVLNKEIIDVDLIDKVIAENNNFSDKKDYYRFRNIWNKTCNNNIDSALKVIKTLLLLKMCSNSMVRFNKKGEFNQGFRGTTTKFFSDVQIVNMKEELKILNQYLYKKDIEIHIGDFSRVEVPKDSLIVADPPYRIRQGFYGEEFTEAQEKQLLHFLEVRRRVNRFILFNYLSYTKDGITVINRELIDFIELNKFKIIRLRNKTTTGQNRNGKTIVEEVIIYNEWR